MEKNKKDLTMRLDLIKKLSGQDAPRLRAMGLLSKAGMFYRFRRIRWALYLICLAIYLVIMGFIEADTLRARGLQCRVDMTCSVPDILAVYIFEMVFLLVAIFLIVTGVKRLINAVWIIEHGTIATAVVGNASETVKTKSVIKGITRFVHTWEYTCSFNDVTGKKAHLKVIVNQKDKLKKGETLDVVYDPGMASNALSLDALPPFVTTDPEMRKA